MVLSKHCLDFRDGALQTLNGVRNLQALCRTMLCLLPAPSASALPCALSGVARGVEPGVVSSRGGVLSRRWRAHSSAASAAAAAAPSSSACLLAFSASSALFTSTWCRLTSARWPSMMIAAAINCSIVHFPLGSPAGLTVQLATHPRTPATALQDGELTRGPASRYLAYSNLARAPMTGHVRPSLLPART